MEKLNTKNRVLFLETSPICLTLNHFICLDKLVAYQSILQKDLQMKTELDKTTISEIKTDFIKLGWCKEINLGSGREICIEICKLNEIKAFLGQWKFLKHTLFVRPHKIKLRCLFKNKPEHFVKAIEAFTTHSDYRLVISYMNNNKEYTLETQYGKIIFFLNGNLIQFCVEGFVLPIRKEDVDILEDYIGEGIKERALAMHSLLKEHFKRFRIEIYDCIYLKSLHTGIVTKENVSKLLSLQGKIKDLGMFVDNSIYGCKEIEAKGKLDAVLNKVKVMLNDLLEKGEVENE
jgi:hypothetical protein